MCACVLVCVCVCVQVCIDYEPADVVNPAVLCSHREWVWAGFRSRCLCVFPHAPLVLFRSLHSHLSTKSHSLKHGNALQQRASSPLHIKACLRPGKSPWNRELLYQMFFPCLELCMFVSFNVWVVGYLCQQ